MGVMDCWRSLFVFLASGWFDSTASTKKCKRNYMKEENEMLGLLGDGVTIKTHLPNPEMAEEQKKELQHRENMTNILLNLCDMMLFGMFEPMVLNAIREAEKANIFRHQVKKDLTDLRSTVRIMLNACQKYDEEFFQGVISFGLKSLKDEYFATGAQFLSVLQYRVEESLRAELKAVSDRCNELSSGFLAYILNIRELHRIFGIVYKLIAKQEKEYARKTWNINTNITHAEYPTLKRLSNISKKLLRAYHANEEDDNLNLLTQNLAIRFLEIISPLHAEVLDSCVDDFSHYCMSHIVACIKNNKMLSTEVSTDIITLFQDGDACRNFLKELRGKADETDHTDVLDIHDEVEFDSPLCAEFMKKMKYGEEANQR